MTARWPDGAPAADVLAAVAQALGVPWDGLGDPTGIAVDVPDDVPAWEVLDATREALVARDAVTRRRLGAHHTAPALARRLAAIALDGCGPDTVVADPACGGGSFLVAAGQLLVQRGAEPRHVVEHQLAGADIDPVAVATTRAALAAWSGGGRAHHVVTADGLGPWRPAGPVDVVVGNPPFRSPLAAGAPAGTLAAYTDLAGRFLVAALDLVRPGGAVLLVQPESMLAARDAGPVRAACGDALAGLWVAGEPAFAAEVRVCAPLVRPGCAPARTVERWTGVDVRPAGRIARDRAAPTWAHLRPDAPPASRRRRAATLRVGDLASSVAGFRDEFYAIAAAVTDGGLGAPVITSGLIDPGRLLWGERPARIAKRRFDRPTVDPAAIDERVRRWVEARLSPKVLVATQTRRIEAAPDRDGRVVPLTPVISVHPHDPDDVDRLTAALSHPEATAWALRHYGGTGLRGDVVKLSASQVLDLPLAAELV